jgi:hypothetical protein
VMSQDWSTGRKCHIQNICGSAWLFMVDVKTTDNFYVVQM